MIFSPRILAVRFKVTWNAWCRRTDRWHRRRCLGSVFCLRPMVYEGCCWRHQEVYDRRAARRLKRRYR